MVSLCRQGELSVLSSSERYDDDSGEESEAGPFHRPYSSSDLNSRASTSQGCSALAVLILLLLLLLLLLLQLDTRPGQGSQGQYGAPRTPREQLGVAALSTVQGSQSCASSRGKV